ncbi:SDR family oxidoreductase [Glycocaulis profundi]|nr:SDR family oxidoreductase [Glycocaulis profundi]
MTTITLITGGSRGLGRNAATHIARRGGDVVITYRSRKEEAETVVAEIEAMGRKAAALRLDVADSSSFSGFAETLASTLQSVFGRDRFDNLVNNAGHGDGGLITQTTEDQFDSLVNTHLKGVFFLTAALAPLMADGGRIVNVSTGLTRMTLPGFAAYAAVKGGVEVLTRYMAKEFGARGIAVNTVAPGAIETDFGGGAVRDDADFNRQIAQATALGRVGVPDDIGPMIASLVSKDNRWINAQRIEVSGGQGL